MPQESELKARMMAAAEAAIDELLAEAEKKDALMLSDIERLVRTAGEAVMTEFTAKMVDAEAQQEASAICPECGEKMRYKGQKGRDLITETGEVRFERAYYYCPACRQGIFPPGPTVGSE
jgi:uncharacterized protein with PIN domain